MPDQRNDNTRRTIELALLLYLLSDSDIMALTALLVTGMAASQIAAYMAGLATIGITGKAWKPNATQLQEIEDKAREAAQSIAETYNGDINKAVDAFIEEYEKTNGALDAKAIEQLDPFLKDWCNNRAAWKSEQVAQYESNSAAYDATQQLVEDVNTGIFDTTEEDDGTVDPLDTSELWLGVVPEDSSGDECAEWAGYMCPIADGGELNFFPMHEGCIHTIQVFNLAA